MTLTEDQKKTYKSIILLNEMITNDRQFSTVGGGDDSILEPLFLELLAKGYIQTTGRYYQATAKGQDVFDIFMKRYAEYLRVYDVFSFVDLDKGEFAFSRYYDFDTDEQWDSFKNDERFEDVRLAVAVFKKIDPSEIVFMSFIDENRFDTTSTGWQIDLMDDDTWKEMEEIVDTAIKPEDLGADAMEDMVTQGSAIMMNLLKQENERNQQDETYTTTEVVEEETVEYYEPYYDPFYVSPIWLVPLFLW